MAELGCGPPQILPNCPTLIYLKEYEHTKVKWLSINIEIYRHDLRGHVACNFQWNQWKR